MSTLKLVTISRFAVVGLLNSAIGFGVILAGLRLGWGDYLANAAGYASGLILSYLLNRRWTFAMKEPSTPDEALRFGGAFAVAFAVNLAVIGAAHRMGLVENPFVQIIAMAGYTITFFLLSHGAVFVGPRHDGTALRSTRPAPGFRSRLKSALPECALAGCALSAWFFIQHIALMNDVAWQFWTARQMLGGTRLYSWIWEVNPPLWFWSAVPLEWLAERLAVPWPTVEATFIVLLGTGIALLVDRMLELTQRQERVSLLLAIFFAVIVIPIAYTGQREQIMFAVSLPYAALIARRRVGRVTPPMLAALIGLLAAYGFAFKHYFVLAPLGLELWLGLHLRRAWRPWRPEMLALAAAAVAYVACILVFAPAYLTVIVPMVNLAYDASNATVLHMLYRPDVFFWSLSAASLLLFRHQVRPHSTDLMAAFARSMLVLAAAFIVVFVIPLKSWGYHSAPATGAIAIAVGLCLMRSRRPAQIVFMLALLIWAATGIYEVEWPARSFGRYIDKVPPGEALFVASTDAGMAWPAVDRRKLVWTSRSYSLWMTAKLIGDHAGADPAALDRMAEQTLAATAQDIRCTPPWLLQIQRVPATPQDPAGLAMQNFLFRDEPLRKFVAQHYVRLPDLPEAVAYARRGRVAGSGDPDCRPIR